MKRIYFLLAAALILSAGLYLGSACSTLKDPVKAHRLDQVDVSDVKLGGEAARRRDIQKKYLFRYQAGKLRNHEGFIDFEEELLKPYTERISESEVQEKILCSYTGVGKMLDAAVVYSDSDNDTILAALKDHYLNTLIASQDSDGYIGYLPHGDSPPLFAMWLMHDGAYICLALIDNYLRFNDEKSLESARKYLDLVIRSWGDAPEAPGVFSPVGITQAFLQMYHITGQPEYLEFFADQAYDGRFIEKETVRKWKQRLFHRMVPSDKAYSTRYESKIHPYRLFLRCMDQLDLNDVQPDKDLELMSDYTLAKMGDIDQPGMYISGATGRHEGWVEDQDGHGTIGEACAVIHQIWWLTRLVEQRGDLSHGDLIERMVLNHMYAAQNSDPDDGRTRYFVPLSGERNYNKGAHCCEGNTRRFWARFPEMVYFTGEDCIAVNLFFPSTMETDFEGTSVTLTQKTRYPLDGKIILQIDPAKSKKFALKIRIPRWAGHYDIKVNGEPIPVGRIKGGIEISRRWERGDQVQLSLPMEFRWIAGELFYNGRAALMRGPQVFCVSRDQNPDLEGISISALNFESASVIAIEPTETVAFRNGQAARVSGKMDSGETFEIIFTDFAEEKGEETYFFITDTAAAVKDELFFENDLEKFHSVLDAGEDLDGLQSH